MAANPDAPAAADFNELNAYSHNFRGVYCRCEGTYAETGIPTVRVLESVSEWHQYCHTIGTVIRFREEKTMASSSSVGVFVSVWEGKSENSLFLLATLTSILRVDYICGAGRNRHDGAVRAMRGLVSRSVHGSGML